MTIQTKAFATVQNTPATSVLHMLMAPFSYGARYALAFTAHRRFARLDDQRLSDIGMTREQAAQMTLQDFMRSPRG